MLRARPLQATEIIHQEAARLRQVQESTQTGTGMSEVPHCVERRTLRKDERSPWPPPFGRGCMFRPGCLHQRHGYPSTL